MKTYILSVLDEAGEEAVRAALADLLAKRLITLESEESADWPGSPPTAEDFAAHLQAALDSPLLTMEQAQAYLASKR